MEKEEGVSAEAALSAGWNTLLGVGISNLSHVHIYEPKCTQGVLVKLTKVGKGKDKLDGGR